MKKGQFFSQAGKRTLGNRRRGVNGPSPEERLILGTKFMSISNVENGRGAKSLRKRVNDDSKSTRKRSKSDSRDQPLML